MNETVQLIDNLEDLRLSLASFNDPSDETQRQAVISGLKALGVDYQPENNVNDGFSDNPNDENYRYADTGYIAGSRKEIAGKHIKQLAKEGKAVRVKDIDWSEIEADPLLAESLIQKSNIIGEFDYSELKNNGVQPETAYLIQKVLYSVASEPHWDLFEFVKKSYGGYVVRRNQNQLLELARQLDDFGAANQKQIMRKAYVAGIDTLKSRISKCKDPRSLYEELKEIAEEMQGITLSADAEKRYKIIQQRVKDLRKQMSDQSLELYNEAEPDLKRIAEDKGIRPVEYNMRPFFLEWAENKYPDREFVSSRVIGKGVVDAGLYQEFKDNQRALETMIATNAFEALTQNRNVQQWVALGERFWAIVEMTSKAFVKHINLALNGKYSDWELTIPSDDGKGGKKKGKKKTQFELIVADTIERKGGREVNINSTEDLKEQFGFRDIQSGNWVLNDKSSAEFHVKNAAAAMMDLSDIVDIDQKALGFNGRLALAFGARGRKGALAHYEPAQRVINITKMKGGGSLGHEWFHAIDNILGEILGGEDATGIGNYLTEKPELAANIEVSIAFAELHGAMMIGDSREPEIFKITEKDIQRAELNVKPDKLNRISKVIYDSGDAETAVIIIDDMLTNKYRKRRSRNHNAWRKIAVAYHNKDKAGEQITLFTGEKVSEFKKQAAVLDGTRAKAYWSSTREMAARAFQAYLEDKLKENDRRNDYLSYGADNDLYQGFKAYPEGDERTRINAAFDKLFKVIKDEKILENAMKDEAAMDSLFGPSIMPLDDLIAW